MRTAWTVLSLTLVINLVLLLGFVGYLHASDRLSKERLRAATAIFRPTFQQQQLAEADAVRLADERQRQAEGVARLQAVSAGPLTLAERLDAERQTSDVAMERLNRMRRTKSDLEAYFNRVQADVQKQRAQLNSRQQDLQQTLEREATRRDDQDFQRAVKMYEQIKPKQAKQMFQNLIAQQKTDQVVQYLAAMQLRKAAAVLKEFKTVDEIDQATELIQRLRERGVDPIPADAQLAGSAP